MEEYIDTLLNEVEAHWLEYIDGEYFLRKARSDHAERILMESLSDKQKDLFLSYEEQRNAAAVLHETCVMRQVFLLAKQFYR